MIDSSYFWINIFVLMIGTIAIRASIILASSRFQMPERAREMFSYFPAAIFPAFIAPAVFFHQGRSQMLGGQERLWVILACALVCVWSRSTLATIAFGLAALYVAQFI